MVVKAILLLIIALQLNQVVFAQDVEMSSREYIDNRIINLETLILEKYDNGINKINAYITVFISLVSLLSIIGYASIYESKKKLNTEVEKARLITIDLQNQKESLTEALSLHTILKKDTETLQIKVTAIINEISNNYHEEIKDIKVTSDNDYEIDGAKIDELKEKFRFMNTSFVEITEYERFIRTIVMYQDNDYEEAEKEINILIKINPRKAQYYFLGGLIAQANNKLDIADEYYEKAVNIDKEYYKAYINSSFIKFRNDKVKESIEYLRKAILINPKIISGWIHLYKIFIDINDFDSALSIQDKIEKIDKSNFDFIYNKACLLLKMKNLDEAYLAFKIVLADNRYKMIAKSDDDYLEAIRQEERFEDLMR